MCRGLSSAGWTTKRAIVLLIGVVPFIVFIPIKHAMKEAGKRKHNKRSSEWAKFAQLLQKQTPEQTSSND